MSEANKIDYTGVITAARRGDEDAYEFLYNDSVRKCRAICMKYFDPATDEGRRKTDDAVREVYVRMYDRIKTLSDPKDFPILGRALTREVCLKKRKLESVQLETEAYIDVANGEKPEETPLVTADECRQEVRGEAMLKSETIGTLVLAVLHQMTPAQRLAIVRWNENDAAAMKDPDVLREAFICAEKSVMELESATGIRAKDYARSRLAFFNWLLDLYGRFYEASTKDWNGAAEPAHLVGDPPAVLHHEHHPAALRPEVHPGRRGRGPGRRPLRGLPRRGRRRNRRSCVGRVSREETGGEKGLPRHLVGPSPCRSRHHHPGAGGGHRDSRATYLSCSDTGVYAICRFRSRTSVRIQHFVMGACQVKSFVWNLYNP